MPRTARLVVPNCPHHIVQRGHNRNAVFVQPRDYVRYLENLGEWKRHFGCKVYGYCLMTNHARNKGTDLFFGESGGVSHASDGKVGGTELSAPHSTTRT